MAFTEDIRVFFRFVFFFSLGVCIKSFGNERINLLSVWPSPHASVSFRTGSQKCFNYLSDDLLCFCGVFGPFIQVFWVFNFVTGCK